MILKYVNEVPWATTLFTGDHWRRVKTGTKHVKHRERKPRSAPTRGAGHRRAGALSTWTRSPPCPHSRANAPPPGKRSLLSVRPAWALAGHVFKRITLSSKIAWRLLCLRVFYSHFEITGGITRRLEELKTLQLCPHGDGLILSNKRIRMSNGEEEEGREGGREEDL